MKRKFIWVFWGLAFVSQILIGCMNIKTSIKEEDLNLIELSISFWEPGTNREMETALTKITESYMRIHPNVSFRLLSQPASEYQDWINAKFATNEAPDIQENHSNRLESQYKRGLIIDISEEYNKINAYANNAIWKDIFADGYLEAAHNNNYEPCFAIPYSALGLAYFYNKDIYASMGLSEPKTWDEFMINCEKIANHGYNPIAMMALKPAAVNWLNWYLLTGLFANKYLGDESINVNMDVVLDSKEFTRAVALGLYDITQGEDREIYEKYLDMLDEFSQYAKGAGGLDEAEAKAQFLAGKAVHIMSGSWDLKGFLENESFEFGTFPLPRFTKNNSEYAGDNFSVSDVAVFGITKSVSKSLEKKQYAIDFMKYFTAPQNYKIFADNTYAIPVVKGLLVDSTFDAFIKGKYPALKLFAEEAQESESSFTAVTFLTISGARINRDKVINDIHRSNLDYVESVSKQINKDNDFMTDSTPRQGIFIPTEPWQE